MRQYKVDIKMSIWDTLKINVNIINSEGESVEYEDLSEDHQIKYHNIISEHIKGNESELYEQTIEESIDDLTVVIEIGLWETIYDTAELLFPDDIGGQATIEVYEVHKQKNTLLWTNLD